MRIESVELHHLRLPLVHPFETSFGREELKDTLVVEVHGGGLTGWGEAPAHGRPAYSADTVDTCWVALHQYILPAVVGKELGSAQDLQEALAFLRGHSFARAGIETAFQDLLARSRKLPLCVHLGGERRPILAGVSLGLQPIPDLMKRVGEFVSRGYRRVKIKIKPEHDRELLEAVRREHPALMLKADANGAYGLADTRHIETFDEFRLLALEQPFAFDDLVDHATLQARIGTPVALDESIPTLGAARSALRLNSMRVANIKLPRMGGHVPSLALRDLCRGAGVPVFCGGMLETGIGRCHNIALATQPGFTIPGDISESARYYEPDIVDPPIVVDASGTITARAEPGIGVEVKRDRLEKVRVRHAKFP